jgi:hypothetical protein
MGKVARAAVALAGITFAIDQPEAPNMLWLTLLLEKAFPSGCIGLPRQLA